MNSKHIVKSDVGKRMVVKPHHIHKMVKREEGRVPVKRIGEVWNWLPEIRDLDRWFSGITEDFGFLPMRLREDTTRGFTPHIEVKETADKVMVTAQLPEFERKDIEVELDVDCLRVRGEKHREKEEKSEDIWRFEQSYGSFERVIPLSGPVDSSKVEAEFKKGVLLITLPKAESSRRHERKVEVKAA